MKNSTRDQREALCRSLLVDMGAKNISLHGNELQHSCVLPLGLHRHGDANPSASINIDKLVFKCFVCGQGSLVWWLATCKGIHTSAARGYLQTQSSGGQSLADLLRHFDQIYNPHNERYLMPSYSPKVLEPWKIIHPYMTEVRQIPPEVLIKFQVGYDQSSNRIVMPMFWKGDLVGWQTRRITNDGTPKYMFSPSFPKQYTIYNYAPTRAAVVVESIISVLTRYSQCPIMEATMGASVTPQQIQLLARHPQVVLFFDNDPAGWKATEEVGAQLIRYTDVRVVDNPWNADAGDLHPDDFGHLMERLVPFGAWHRPKEVEEYDQQSSPSTRCVSEAK